MKKEYDVIIVGGGPSGSMAAIEIAKANLSVCILEKKTKVGIPVRCGEAIGFSGLNKFFEPDDTWIASTINSINLVSPNSIDSKIVFKNETGYILHRKKFDSGLSNIAVENGAEVLNKDSYYIDLDFDCETVMDENVYYDIYGTEAEPEICLD